MSGIKCTYTENSAKHHDGFAEFSLLGKFKTAGFFLGEKQAETRKASVLANVFSAYAVVQ
ncbi:hypothetical protein D920_01445 [Enterococcus faecalis 13-SD-W-01]|nr:hypothetical protein D920_01445 [Enterococcus faecalis 13-SD-W-01]